MNNENHSFKIERAKLDVDLPGALKAFGLYVAKDEKTVTISDQPIRRSATEDSPNQLLFQFA